MMHRCGFRYEYNKEHQLNIGVEVMSGIGWRAVWVAGLLMGLSMSGTAAVKVNMDWPSYMAKQDLYFTSLPQVWTEAPFIGREKDWAT
jgi:hypothetical protein